MEHVQVGHYDIDLAELQSLDLEQLARRALIEQNATDDGMNSTMTHAYRLGCILLTARDKLGRGNWRSWLNANNINVTLAGRSMRFVTYFDHLPAEAFDVWEDDRGKRREPSLSRAVKVYLAGLPNINESGAPRRFSASARELAMEMHSDGKSWEHIAEVVGASSATVREWLDPKRAARRQRQRVATQKRRRAERRALAEMERKKSAVRIAKGSTYEHAYGLVRQLCVALSAIEPDSAGRRDAYQAATRCEALIVDAMRRARQSD